MQFSSGLKAAGDSPAVATGRRTLGPLSNGHAGAIPRARMQRAMELYRTMLTARWVDRVEMELVNRGEGFFHVGGAGHEASCVLAGHLTPDDWLHLHYRDKALMMARGIPPIQFFHSLLCTAESHSAGRQMSAHLSAPELKILSLVGPVGNNALQAVGVAHEIRHQIVSGLRAKTAKSPIVLCVVGDGTTQQGEVLEAIGEAVRAQLPVLFLIEDNQLAISTTTTGTTFYDLPKGPAAEFYGLPIHRFDGRSVLDCDLELGALVAQLRTGSGPAIAVLAVERLTHHTNADDERAYRAESEISEVRAQADPILLLRDRLLASGVTSAQLESLEREIEAGVRADADTALVAPNPEVNFDARAKLNVPTAPAAPYRNGTAPNESKPRTMIEAMRDVLRARLSGDPRVTLFGEDIEDPKGDVFGLTRGLTTAFPRQVKNAALTESTILGVSIGRAMAGGRPVAFIQFADFLPLAYNQIASELGSLYWRTNGGWPAPVLILAPCGGYRPGLGPFHAQTFESTFAHVPGLDVVMPSSAADAAGLLNSALDGGRPTLFLYPKVLLNDAAAATTAAVEEFRVPVGSARILAEGTELTLVTWGATVALCQRAAQALAGAGVSCDLIDLRSISPWDRETVLSSVRKTGRVIVVHEDNHSCGFGAEVLATVLEHAGQPVAGRRVTRPDTYVPCNYTNQLEVLPSLKRVIETAASLCDLEVSFRDRDAAVSGEFVLQAVGSSPADQNVTVLEWKVRDGDTIKAGDMLAECEADKATFELRAPMGGRIEQLLTEGEQVKVGATLALIRTQAGARNMRRVPNELVPVIRKRTSTVRPVAQAKSVMDAPAVVGLTGLSFVTGSRLVSNEEVAAWFPNRSAADIQQRTGIEQRYFCGEGESALTLAAAAADKALAAAGLTVTDLDAIYVSTSTPVSISPSLACLVHHHLCKKSGTTKDLPAVDLLAACSGWLYALQAAYDLCHQDPSARVLVITSEAMSRFLDHSDFDTAIVFGDAATATIVSGGAHMSGASVTMRRPVLSARGEDGSILSLGRMDGRTCDAVSMDGLKVFPIAVRKMPAMLEMACAEAGFAAKDLDWIIPHQANGRIIAAAQRHAGLQMGRIINNVARYGNTSSSSIPIALAEMLAEGKTGRIGLCAFGGGFTFGAAVVDAK
ncbi:MAG TPA: beta-ketoacyl-ACP synthase 3 [Candidatus Limnocylindria bacterium]|jgi:2-oxoisovalerate dehydrogenase E1 component|nr:beta-ketoacyl-ACP synthase 3 [Candidatus Limnocylindria bacterium]